MTLDITLAPQDAAFAEHVLPHQLRQWASQVADVQCVLDLRPSPGTVVQHRRRQQRRLLEIVDRCLEPYGHARRLVVDYSAREAKLIGGMFLCGSRPPLKDFRGGPFYSYFYGLHKASSDAVLHLDSDMLFGGGSQSWVAEGLDLLRRREDVLACRPLPGPPTADGTLRTHRSLGEWHEREEGPGVAYCFRTFTTRSFLLDRRRFRERVGGVQVVEHEPVRRRVGAHEWLQALTIPGGRLSALRRPLVLSTLPYELPERLFADAMNASGLCRIDFLGRPPGVWSVHPRDRPPVFYRQLPRLIARIEAGDVTDSQRGRYDLDDSMVAEPLSTGSAAGGAKA